MMEEMINDISPEEKIFLDTKAAIKEIFQTDIMNEIRKYVFNEHEFKFEHEDIVGMLPHLQAINLGIKNDVVVEDIEGNEITMTADEFVQRNHVAFVNKTKKEIELNILNKAIDAVETFAEFIDFKNLEVARETFIPKEEEKVEEKEEEIGTPEVIVDGELVEEGE